VIALCFFYKFIIDDVRDIVVMDSMVRRNGSMNEEIKELATATDKNYKNCATEKIKGFLRVSDILSGKSD